MKKTTNNSKLVVLSLLLLNITTFAQQWNFYKGIAPNYEPKEITGRANGDLFLQNREAIFMKSLSYPQWYRLQNTASTSFLIADWNANALYSDQLTGISLSKYYNITNYNQIGFIESSNFHVSNISGFGAFTYDLLIDGNTLIAITDRDFSSNGSIQPGVSVWKNTQNGLNGFWSNNLDFDELYTTSTVLSSGKYILGSWEGTILKTIDGGTTWNQVSDQPFVFKRIQKAFGNTIYAITYVSDGNFNTNYPFDDTNFSTYKIKKSTDDGATWTDVTISAPIQRFRTLKFNSESQTLYLTGDKGIYTLNSENGIWNNITYNLDNTSIISAVKIGSQIFCTTGDGEEAYQVFKKNENDNFWTNFDIGLNLPSLNSNLNLNNNFSFNSDNKIILDAPFKNRIITESASDWTRNAVSGFFDSNLNLPLNIYKMIKNPFNNDVYCGKAISSNNSVGYTVNLYKTSDLGTTTQLIPNLTDFHYILSFNSSGNFIYRGLENDDNIYFYDANAQISYIVNMVSDSQILNFAFLTENNKVFLNLTDFVFDETYNILNNFDGSQTNLLTLNFAPNKAINSLLYGFFFDETDAHYHFKKYDLNSNTETELSVHSEWDGASAMEQAQILFNGNTIYICNQTAIYKSIDGGTSWVNIPVNAPSVIANRKYNLDNNGVLFTEFYDANATTGNGYYYWTDAMANEEYNHSNIFSIYPNPTKGIIQISGLKQAEEVTIYNMLGQQVLTQKLTNANQTLDISSLNSGSYFVKISASDAHQTITLLKE